MPVQSLRAALRPILVTLPATALILGLGLQWSALGAWSKWIWIAATLAVLAALLADIVAGLRRGNVGLDVVAAFSMTGALIFGEHLAAVVVALMYAGGQYLESFAERHARREMTALLARVSRTAMRHRNGQLEEVALEKIQPQDRLLIRQGDTIPVDGTVVDRIAILDQSALTGEALPVQKPAGEAVMSGSTNVGHAFDLLASRRAAESTYAGIVRLVEAAQRSKAPMSRLADRFALMFLGITLVLAGNAWFWTGDPIRAVAVLVIATPCPLILAVPVAIISGLSRAARHGILIKSGQALETMARVRALVIDKTGTLTQGRAGLLSIHTVSDQPADEVLRLAASLDQASKHVIAQTIVTAAIDRKLDLTVPANVQEIPGEGIEGYVDGRHVIVGGRRFIAERLAASPPPPSADARYPGAVVVAIAVDGRLVAELILSDELRTGTSALLRHLKNLGVNRIVLATGDRREVAENIADGLAIDAVRFELTPDQKVITVIAERKYGPVMMIGDGVNDAPALAAADVGVALGARGSAASTEAADVVLLVDRLDGILPAIRIARRAKFIALESVYAGIGLSVLGMITAAFGFITPLQAALLQEAIDVGVVFNALRVLMDSSAERQERSGRVAVLDRV